MEFEPIWAEYATFDENGFIDGIMDDAPEEIKKAFNEYQRKKTREKESKTPIFKT